jgi:hypothetical protein
MESLESLRLICDSEMGYDYMNCLQFPAVVDIGLARKIMMGALDWSIKLGHPAFLTKLQQLLTQVIEQPNQKSQDYRLNRSWL